LTENRRGELFFPRDTTFGMNATTIIVLMRIYTVADSLLLATHLPAR